MDANMLLSWHKYGGGKELLNKLYASIGANVVSFPYGPMPTQPLGWFKKPITKPDDFKGMKYRTVGISIDLFNGMGAAVNALPGSEIVPAIDRGLLDAAEFNNATSDRILGFPDVSKVCMLQRQLEVFDQVNAKKSAENPMWKEISESQRAYAERTVRWDLDTNVGRRMAYNWYFGKKPAAKKA